MGDNSITEGYAMLFDHLMQDAGWLRRYTGLEKKAVPAYLRTAGFEELHFLRRYCAKLIYETQLYGGDVRWESLPDLYVQVMQDATTFIYSRSDKWLYLLEGRGLEEMPLRLLSPYQSLSEETYQTCARIFREKYADWSAGWRFLPHPAATGRRPALLA